MSVVTEIVFIYLQYVTYCNLLCDLLAGDDTGCFQHRYTDFGHDISGMPKFNLKSNLNYQKEQLRFVDYIDHI